MESIGEHPVSSRDFWNKINKTRNTKTCSFIPTIKIGDDEFKTDEDKANLFAKNLETIFSADDQPNEFDDSHLDSINTTINNFDLSNVPFVHFSS